MDVKGFPVWSNDCSCYKVESSGFKNLIPCSTQYPEHKCVLILSQIIFLKEALHCVLQARLFSKILLYSELISEKETVPKCIRLSELYQQLQTKGLLLSVLLHRSPAAKMYAFQLHPIPKMMPVSTVSICEGDNAFHC